MRARGHRASWGILICLSALSLATPALADEEVPAAVEASGGVVPIEAGERAPWAGLLLTESAFEVAATARVRAAELAGQVEVREQAIARLEAALAAVPVSEPCVESWWARYGWAVGLVGGVVVSGVLVWGAVEVLGSARE